MGIVDLHMHSIYSDGTKRPEELIAMAKAKGLKVIALTDHDNIMGSQKFVKLDKQGLTIYSGVELTVKVAQGRMHILGYNIRLDDDVLNSTLKEMHEVSIYNLLLYVRLLKKDYGINITDEELEPIVNAVSNVGRPQLAYLLIKKGFCKDVDEAFDMYLNPVYEKARRKKRGLTREEAIKLITGAGGVASLAHPVSLRLSDSDLKEEVKQLYSYGLGAIETIHSNIPDYKRVSYHKIARYYDLLETGGSDFHGEEVKPALKMGSGCDDNVDIGEKTLSFVKSIKSRY